jgi:hypothetical protein
VPGGAWFFSTGDKALCSGMIGSWIAQGRNQPDARGLVRALDSLLTTGPPTFLTEGGLVAARLLEAGDDTSGALRALRRRTDDLDYLAPVLREEGRLAAITGDTAGAVRAYRHYLALRADPEPELRLEAAWVRRELARLQPGANRVEE